MGFDYLYGKNWKDISRDERRFCADLVFQLKTSKIEAEFIFDYELNKNVTLADKKGIKGFLKRTFDICIFLPDDIIIIEAKAAKWMTSEQMMEFKYDKLAISSCLKYLKLPKKNVHVIGLVSQEYDTSNIIMLNKKHNYFNGIISWADIEDAQLLNYKQPSKLKSVFKETNKKRKQGKLELINHLLDLTNRMHKHMNKKF